MLLSLIMSKFAADKKDNETIYSINPPLGCVTCCCDSRRVRYVMYVMQKQPCHRAFSHYLGYGQYSHLKR